jgi:hypothetical protein
VTSVCSIPSNPHPLFEWKKIPPELTEEQMRMSQKTDFNKRQDEYWRTWFPRWEGMEIPLDFQVPVTVHFGIGFNYKRE